ncbi:hypothetical protein ABZ721_10960 [Streptomyces sp. NPDC006733]|uniref:hypothetical protein n=1 Tax=Streptomyces sp. NPDC006733 TaxID=3155460 RepID=UPI0033C8BA06
MVQEKAADTMGTARDESRRVFQETSDQGRQLVDRFRDTVGDQADEQVRRLAANLRHLVAELREMSETGKPDSAAAALIRRVAGQGDSVADLLEQRSPGEVLGEIQGFARRRPGIFLAGAALAGFSATRLGKGVSAASGGNREAGRWSHPEQSGTARGEVPPYPAAPPIAPAEPYAVEPSAAPRAEPDIQPPSHPLDRPLMAAPDAPRPGAEERVIPKAAPVQPQPAPRPTSQER